MTHRVPKHLRAIDGYARQACDEAGASVHREHGGKHEKFIIEGWGTRRIVIVATSPRNLDDAIDLGRKDIRRVLREMCT